MKKQSVEMDVWVQRVNNMAKRIDDLTGQQFGYLVVLEYVGNNRHGHALWNCLCTNCGTEKIIQGSKLKHGETKSCGCMHHYYSHHQTNTRLYHIWCTIKARCNRPTALKYKDYGGRGIKLCESWHKFENFYEWAISHGYSDDLSIDRINNDGNYEPDNCRWTDNKTQANNTRANKRIEYNGEILTLSQLAEKYQISYTLLTKRLYRGWNIDDAINIPNLGNISLKKYKEQLKITKLGE